jgi:hypothetical protein
MAKRQNKSWVPSYRADQDKAVRSARHHVSGLASAAQHAAESWTTDQLRNRLADARHHLELAEATVARYEEEQEAA